VSFNKLLDTFIQNTLSAAVHGLSYW